MKKIKDVPIKVRCEQCDRFDDLKKMTEHYVLIGDKKKIRYHQCEECERVFGKPKENY